MKSLSKPSLVRWPPWAGGGDFRRRAESALTHPVTVAALGVLLLNDLLFKALWPHSWLTGKLSDLAWLMFALPLLAFLLSFAARGSLRASRLAFLVAYAGLPILYAAFNTFEPVHDVIMRGISLAGGAAGSPRDATDSLVIPLAWAAALWVWRREVPAAGAMRLRWAVLVAGVAALASVATSESGPVYGVQKIGVSPDGLVVADVDYGGFWSLDGGLTWNPIEHQLGDIAWGDQDVETPRGRYILDGPRVLRVSADGAKEEVVYSAEYLKQDGNVWVQTVSTESLGRRSIGTQPVAMVYDERSGNLALAMGIQGVVVGTSDGQWVPRTVAQFKPTDFSLETKTRLLLFDFDFHTSVLILALAMTGAAFIASQHRRQDLLRSVLIAPIAGIAAMFMVGTLFLLPLYLALFVPPVSNVPQTVIVLLVVPLGSGFVIGSEARRSEFWNIGVIGVGILAISMSGLSTASYVVSYDEGSGYLRGMFHPLDSDQVLPWVLAVTSLAVSWPLLLRHWVVAVASIVGMTTLVVIAFLLWLHLGVSNELTQFSAIALSGVIAILLAVHLSRRTRFEGNPCWACGKLTIALYTGCPNCGALLMGSEEDHPVSSPLGASVQGRCAGLGPRILAGMMDLSIVLIVVGIGSFVVWFLDSGIYHIFDLISHILFLLAFSLLYNPVPVGRFAATPGKRALKLRVVRSNGSRVGYRRALVRELAKFGPLLTVNAVVMAFRSDRRGLHDLLADTVVVRLDGQ